MKNPEQQPVIVLGSRSPRRLDLMSSIAGARSLRVLPPVSEDEPGFDGLDTCEQIETRLREIVRLKYEDVCRQLDETAAVANADNPPSAANTSPGFVVVCADTTVVVTEETTGRRCVLGKPPDDNWTPVVRNWFQRYYLGRTHEVWTGVRIGRPSTNDVEEIVVRTSVRFSRCSEGMLEWYLSTNESTGKAGGYGIQDNAAVFVEGLDGSLTNVIGLPVLEVADALNRLTV